MAVLESWLGLLLESSWGQGTIPHFYYCVKLLCELCGKYIIQVIKNANMCAKNMAGGHQGTKLLHCLDFTNKNPFLRWGRSSTHWSQQTWQNFRLQDLPCFFKSEPQRSPTRVRNKIVAQTHLELTKRKPLCTCSAQKSVLHSGSESFADILKIQRS